MRTWFAVMIVSILTGTVHAAPFIVNEAHCNIITLNAVRATYAKLDGTSYTDFVRQIVSQVNESLYPVDTVVMDTIPYSLEMAHEYYFNDIKDYDKYVDDISDKCIENIGATAL